MPKGSHIRKRTKFVTATPLFAQSLERVQFVCFLIFIEYKVKKCD